MSDDQSTGRLLTYRQLGDRPDPVRGTAWGLWGPNDQIGTLNNLSPGRVLAALRSVLEGRVIPLNLPLTEFDPPLIAHRGAVEHTVFGLNAFHRDDRLDSFYPQASTQIDGLRHFGHPDRGFYNTADAESLVAGTPDLGIQAVAQRGIAGRGLLIDIGAYRDAVGRPIDHSTNEQLAVSDLEGALLQQHSIVEPGDILLIRTGWLGHVRAHRPDGPLSSPGLAHTETIAAWLWDHEIALAAADNIALEAWPATASVLEVDAERSGELARSSHSGMLHRILIPLLGLAIGELWDLDVLADACERRGRYDCLVTAQPLNMQGGVGSPANAMALL